MTTQVANVSRLYGSVVELHLVATPAPEKPIRGKITGVDGIGVSIVEPAGDTAGGDTAGETGGEQFFPWTSIERIVVT